MYYRNVNFQSLGLVPLYGKCGTSNTSYFGDEKYTHIRCDRQCETDIIVKTCGCKDAYMPGPFPVCGISGFLDCIVPTSCGYLFSEYMVVIISISQYPGMY